MKGKTVLIVGTGVEAISIVRALAEEYKNKQINDVIVVNPENPINDIILAKQMTIGHAAIIVCDTNIGEALSVEMAIAKDKDIIMHMPVEDIIIKENPFHELTCNKLIEPYTPIYEEAYRKPHTDRHVKRHNRKSKW